MPKFYKIYHIFYCIVVDIYLLIVHANSVLASQLTRCASVIKTDLSVSYRGIIAAEFRNRMEYIKNYVDNSEYSVLELTAHTVNTKLLKVNRKCFIGNI
jgi:hypothetical protein